MVRPRRFLRALAGAAGIAAAATTLTVVPAVIGSPAATASATTGQAAGAPRKVPLAELKVTIDHLMPAYLPTTGTIHVSGTITNRSDEPWTDIRVYAFAAQHDGVADGPMTNAAELAKAAAVPAEADVGSRLTPQLHPHFDHLAPGETVVYHLDVPADQILAHAAGVYWFGVHVLGGSTNSPDDTNADGRARTLLPFVPARVSDTQPALPTALVLPLSRPLSYDSTGTVADPAAWTRGLNHGGRVRDVVDFGAAAGPTPVTWLVDPALFDAAGQLAAGNPGVSLATQETLDPTPTTTSPTASSTPTTDARPTIVPTPVPTPTTTPTDPTLAAAAQAAVGFLTEFSEVATGDQVLSLPYGNLDLAGAQHSPDADLITTATGLSSTELTALGITTTPAIASPRGYLDTDTIADAGDDTTVLASDAMFPKQTAGVAQVGDQRVVVTSSGAAAGGPGPEPAIGMIGLRQRILAEAAVRLLKPDPQPLVVVLPTNWSLDRAREFFAGLRASWLDLESVADATGDAPARPVASKDLTYPPLQARRENDAETYASVHAVIADGQTLQTLLTGRTAVADTITRMALSGASYAARSEQTLARAWLTGVSGWVHGQLSSIDISAPKGVTLSSASGKFAATLTNRLDETVSVAVTARPDPGITIGGSRTVQLGPHSHTTVLLEVRASSNKVHNVTLMVTDSAGTPLGPTDQLPIRSAQVSQVIWLIMGSGVVILFLAIAVRLVRRFRRSRRGPPAGEVSRA